jgi:uncharacterized membrane protein
LVHRRRHLAKAISYRFFGSLVTAIVVFLLTNDLNITLAFFAIESVGKIVLYYVHERVWYHVSWGIEHKEHKDDKMGSSY